MPVLDGLRHGEPVDGSASSEFNAVPNRQKVVVVGLGMVAISFMWVGQESQVAIIR